MSVPSRSFDTRPDCPNRAPHRLPGGSAERRARRAEDLGTAFRSDHGT
jgi:hypothetical protein